MSKGTQFTGDWAQFEQWLVRVPRTSRVILELIVENFSKKMMRKVRAHIRAQDLSWTPLAMSTIIRKKHQRVYVDSGAYAKNVRLEKKRTRKGTQFLMGPTSAQTKTGLTFQELALFMEYGTSRMPARALWRPTYEEIKATKEFKIVLDRATEGF